MTTLLYIKASRRPEAKSTAIANAYLSALTAKNTSLHIDTLDLSEEELLDYDGDAVAAKMNVFGGQQNTGALKTKWDAIVAAAQRFIDADRYLFSVPMWNSGIPYKLKQYIDIIHQPGLLFGFDPARGYFGLLKNKKAVLALTSGVYGPGVAPSFGVDHHSAYLHFWLNQAGVSDIQDLRFQPSMLADNPEASFNQVIEAAQRLGKVG